LSESNLSRKQGEQGHVRYGDVRLILETSINNANDLQATQASHLLFHEMVIVTLQNRIKGQWFFFGVKLKLDINSSKCVIASAYK
jgi:hypothetical protein